MGASSVEDAQAVDTLLKAVATFVERLVAIFGPLPTAGLGVTFVVAALVALRWWLHRKNEEEANARRGYELTVEKMSSEIRSLRAQLLQAQGMPLDEIQRFLDLTEGYRQKALAGDPPAQAPVPAGGPQPAPPAPLAKKSAKAKR